MTSAFILTCRAISSWYIGYVRSETIMKYITTSPISTIPPSRGFGFLSGVGSVIDISGTCFYYPAPISLGGFNQDGQALYQDFLRSMPKLKDFHGENAVRLW